MRLLAALLALVIAAPAGAATVASPACRYTDVEVGYTTVCALRADNHHADCWGAGANTTGIATAPNTAFAKIGVGTTHACGIKAADGGVQCWGTVPSGTPSDTGLTGIAWASGAPCVLKADGSISCWGAESYDPATGACTSWPHVGTTCTMTRTPPTWAGRSQAPTGPYVQISGDGPAACGVETDGSISCWGDRGNFPNVFSDIPSGTNWVEVQAGWANFCARDSGGSVTCWGNNGANASNSSGEHNVPAGTYTRATAGVEFGCGLKTSNGLPVCWGASWLVDAANPGKFRSLTDISGTYSVACGVSVAGVVYCWGTDNSGLDLLSPPAECPQASYFTQVIQ